MQKSNFVHLHNHTHYSLLDGLTKIDEMIEKAKQEGSEAVAITDHGVMYGVIEFYQKCLKANIKPIIGVESYLAPRSRHKKETKEDSKNYHLLLLAKNNQGYKNLIKLTSLAHLEGFYYKPRIDWELLEKHHEGLIASSACLGGEIPKLILSKNLEKAEKRILEYNELFGQDNFYLEIQDHPELEGQIQVNKELIKLSKKLNIPLIATNDIHYLDKDDAETQDILLCIQNKKKKDDANRMKMLGFGDYSMRSNTEMIEVFKDIPEAIENTIKIAKKCNVEIELGKIQLPSFEIPKDFDENSYLEELCKQGIQKKYNKNYDEINLEVKERLNYELSIIREMGFASYFLITADFINWAKQQKIAVGPGRGSGGGSLICYLINITTLDPIKHDLLFERFLNPERVTMPDFDIDFADTRREEVIRYVEEKYGQDHVSQIATFGTMAARASVKDVGRALDYSYEYCDKLAKMIPMFSSIQNALDTVPEFKEIYQNENQAEEIINYAKKLEGVARHVSRHACGVLITNKPLTSYTPIQHASASDKTIISQYSVYRVDEIGLLKIDFLGLKNLTVIETAIKIIKNTKNIDIDIDNIPLDDKKVYRLFQKGETTGVFQFESSGMKRYLRELKPSEFEDLIAMVSLYRPGPMEWIPDYINVKHGKKKISYLHPKLKPILEKTHGVAIYQEQIMKMGRDLAGFTLGEADILRRAIGKKKVKLLEEQKNKFIQGCIKNKIDEKLAKKIFSFIEPFAGYGFNRSHATGYATIAYQTAYLKTYFPTEFMAALLTSDQENSDRVAIIIEECKRNKINVMPPNINESFETFTVVNSSLESNSKKENSTIRFGLRAIKNVGENIAQVIIKNRKEKGIFKDITDFLTRITDKDLNKKSLESLIKSGSMDQYEKREKLISNLDYLVKFNHDNTQKIKNAQISLFAKTDLIEDPKVELPNQEITIPKREKLNWEKELLGLYITEHPFSEFRKTLKNNITHLEELNNTITKDINTSGIIIDIKKIITRKNEAMIFARIENEIRSVEVLVFPKLLQVNPDLWEEGNTILINGKISDKDQEIKILANKAINLDINNTTRSLKEFNIENKNRKIKIIENNPLKIILKKQFKKEELEKLKNILRNFSGKDEVFLKIFLDEKKFQVIKTDITVNNSINLENTLYEKFSDAIEIIKKN